MKMTVWFLLVGTGGLVTALGLLTQQSAPELAGPTFWAGLVGGVLSMVWGALGLAGKPHRGWAVFTLAVTAFVLLSQVVTQWMPAGQPTPDSRTLLLLAIGMLLATLVALMVVAHSGVSAPRPDRGGATAGPVDGDSPGSDSSPAQKEKQRQRVSTFNAGPR